MAKSFKFSIPTLKKSFWLTYPNPIFKSALYLFSKSFQDSLSLVESEEVCVGSWDSHGNYKNMECDANKENIWRSRRVSRSKDDWKGVIKNKLPKRFLLRAILTSARSTKWFEWFRCNKLKVLFTVVICIMLQTK